MKSFDQLCMVFLSSTIIIMVDAHEHNKNENNNNNDFTLSSPLNQIKTFTKMREKKMCENQCNKSVISIRLRTSIVADVNSF